MSFRDPFEPSGVSHFECVECGDRQTTADRVTGCPTCGGTVQNLSVPRHQ
ncbi:rubrerythrin-like domain-containing protein [Salinigranum sp.]